MSKVSASGVISRPFPPNFDSFIGSTTSPMVGAQIPRDYPFFFVKEV
jgi:hypothetical protein